MSSANSRRVWRNTLTISGAWLASIALVFTLSFFFFDLLTPTPSPYIGIVTFFVFPILIILGLTMMVVGFLWKRRQLHRFHGSLSELEYYPRIDFNDPRQQRWLVGLACVAMLIVVFIGVMSYEGYHYTDSNNFCGTVCHAVMHPEYTAYQYSPHARVECTECHVGSGAAHYLKAKLTGVRQVIAVALDSYEKPLPAAITELRPATETCERCHWPQMFLGEQLVATTRFASDEASTARDLGMLMKTGGRKPLTGMSDGIHSHISDTRTIEFVALDDALQEIPWFRVTNRETGTQSVYRSDGLAADAPAPAGIRRTMDCMDCHNRASHRYRAPADSADSALASQSELRALPYAKRELVAALSQKYETRDQGVAGVRSAIESYYRGSHPEVMATKPDQVAALAAIGSELYRRSTFPDMNVDWRSYPDNIGHLRFPGCFRCHAGRHLDAEGNAYRSDCTTCHDFLARRDDGGVARSGEFVHPVELEGVHAELGCDECHAGGPMPEPTCEGCHADAVAFMAGTTAELEQFDIEPDVMDGLAECTDCHDLSTQMTSASLNTACLECHEGEDYAAPGTIERQRQEIARRLDALHTVDARTQRLIESVRAAGPLHNFEGAKRILDALAAKGS